MELAAATKPKGVVVLPHPMLLKSFEEKVRNPRTSLNDPTVRGGAVDLIQDLLETITICPDHGAGAEAEVVAETGLPAMPDPVV